MIEIACSLAITVRMTVDSWRACADRRTALSMIAGIGQSAVGSYWTFGYYWSFWGPKPCPCMHADLLRCRTTVRLGSVPRVLVECTACCSDD